MYTVDRNDILDHMYCFKFVNLLSIQNIMLQYQYLNMVELNLKEAL